MDARERFLAAEAAYLGHCGVSCTSSFVDLGDGRTVRVLETAGSGTPALLLPGVGAVASVWAPLIARLAGRRVLAVDRPGCGLSSRFDLRGEGLRPWSIRLIDALIDRLGLGSVSLVGNSIGGTMALWYASVHPRRVERIALLGAPPFVLDAQAPLGMRLLSIGPIGRRALGRRGRAAIEATFVQLGHSREVVDDALADLAAASNDLPGFADGFLGLLRAATGLRGRRVSVPAEQLASIAAPTLIVWGPQDAHGSPRTGERMVATMPSARLELRGRGHLPWLDDPIGCGTLVSAFLSVRETGTVAV